MTVIAWDGMTLAADKRATKWGLAYTVTKIFRVGDHLVGVAGDATRGQELIAWIRDGADPTKYPPLQDRENPAFLTCIARDGTIRLYEKTAYPYVVEERQWADGEGRDFALAAMRMGKDARAAVEFASSFVTGCGNGVDTLSFDEA